VPELPEVETVACALRPHLLGRRITGVETFCAALRTPLRLEADAERLTARIVDIRRRAKYIIVELGNLQVILMHLGMTGYCRIVPAKEPRLKHEHVVFTLDDGLTWRFNDARRFGRVEVHSVPRPGAEPEVLAGLGAEPLSEAFSGDMLHRLCRGRKTPVKHLIMDGRHLVGVGNIYASEALWRAGIHPARAAGRISRRRCDALVESIRHVLTESIAAGGSTIADFRTVDGSEGQFSLRLDAYGRDDEACKRCETGRIRRRTMSGRATFYCPRCQR
jgi:formamidopyrimidine-DNA glycosylase